MINYNKLHDLSCQYWDALDQGCPKYADFIDSCLEREGVARLPREDCEEPILDLSPLEVN